MSVPGELRGRDCTRGAWVGVLGRLGCLRAGCAISVAFSPNSKQVVSGSDDKTVRLWDAATGALLQTLKGHSDSVLTYILSYN